MVSRRHFFQVACGMWGALFVPDAVSQQITSGEVPRPDPKLFQAGDFVWPKKPGAYVPYNAGSSNSPEADAALWTAEKNRYITANSTSADPLVQRRINRLSSMDYREFIAIYEGNQVPGVPGVYSGGGFYVGHVGIIDIGPDNRPFVVEALLGHGVVSNTYDNWIQQRNDQLVWLARLRGKSRTERASIAVEAKRYLGRPYDFWNFNLADDSAFYCSKLCWLSVFRSLGLAVDNDPDPNRLIWFSPKQFLSVPILEKLHDPGPYATR